MLGTLSSKTQQKIGISKQSSIGRGAKFINDPIALPHIDWIPDHDTPIRDNQTMTKDSPKKYNLRKSVNPP